MTKEINFVLKEFVDPNGVFSVQTTHSLFFRRRPMTVSGLVPDRNSGIKSVKHTGEYRTVRKAFKAAQQTFNKL